MGWGSRRSISNYVFNHLGNFATAGEATCRALFMHGVPVRFPRLRFAFLEGGVAWGANLRADLCAHLEKRGPASLGSLDPRALDREMLRDLFERYAPKRFQENLGDLDAALAVLSQPDEDPATRNEFARSGVASAADVHAIFDRFHFGCEADDPLVTTAFDAGGEHPAPPLRAILGSDIGHWDVPDVTQVLHEAWELVEHGRISEAQLRAFLFENPVSLFAGANPRFFEGTHVGDAVRAAG
jgi:hypothetical protein